MANSTIPQFSKHERGDEAEGEGVVVHDSGGDFDVAALEILEGVEPGALQAGGHASRDGLVVCDDELLW